jgi:hypothetical protein
VHNDAVGPASAKIFKHLGKDRPAAFGSRFPLFKPLRDIECVTRGVLLDGSLLRFQ